MMITSKSMAPIARRKKPKDGSGIKALPFLFAFAIGFERQVGGLVPKPPRRKSESYKKNHGLLLSCRAGARMGNKCLMLRVVMARSTWVKKRRRQCQFCCGF